MSAAAPPGVRLRVQRMLDGAALEPPGLPAASLLVVRALRDPLPGRLGARRGDVRASAAWQAAVRDVLAERWRGAARPLRGPVPPTAEAVWFADTAEMIAAFARDACAGETRRWWWQALVRGLPGGPLAQLGALWAREARHVPAALEHLLPRGEAARVVSALPPAQASRVLSAVAHAFAVPALLAAPPPADPSAARPPSTDPRTVPRNGGDSGDDRRAAASGASPPSPALPTFRAAPPWRGFVPEDAVPRGLPADAAALLGLSLMLHRAPLVARGGDFAARFVRWRAEAASPRPADPPRPHSSPSTEPHRPDAPSDDADPRPSSDLIGDTSSPIASTEDGIARPPLTEANPIDRPRDGGSDADGDVARAIDSHPPIPTDSADAAEGEDAHRSTDEIVGKVDGGAGDAADGWDVRVFPPTAEEARAASAACGIFFLVNVMRALGFFRALDGHYALPPVVGGWGWMDLVARALLGPRAAGLEDDAIWRVLAELDGRGADEPPGAGFRPPATETRPDAWIGLFRGAPPEPAPSPPLGMRASADLQRFLDGVVPIVRARVHAALAAAGGDPEEGLETALFRRLGTVEATRTHVDVHMDIGQVTLPVRLSGLDADPGWVPELARVVTFHFA